MISLNLDLSVSNIGPTRKAVCFGKARYKTGGRFGPRVQRDHQLVVILQGSVVIDREDPIGKKVPTIKLQHGEMTVLEPGYTEHFRFDERHETIHTWLSFAPSALESGMASKLNALPAVVSASTRVQELLDQGLRISSDRLESAETFMEALGKAILEAVIWEADSHSKHKAIPEPLRLALELVGARFTEPLTLEQLSDAAYVTPQHLVRLFRAHIGETPMRYVWRIRTERGVQMLRQTGISVAEAAHRVGFKNVYHFSRAVKERYGKSPMQLRKEEWGLTEDRVG